ncbi:c-type cytochrome [Parerythrobacter aurantius]|uniref:c-type cytochrome n=1 Tax=Parerythrobacter aurantius TaxID=3127706 RepID=UPI003247991D
MSLRLATVASCALLLAACGSAEQPPVEQIVVREPGQASAASPSVPAGPVPAAGDLVTRGKAAFASCAACHSVEPGAPSGVGPNLHGVVGRKAGAVEGFAYSDALKRSGLTWSAAELDAFLADPAARVPGTAMAAGAVSEEATRKAIIAYLATLTG